MRFVVGGPPNSGKSVLTVALLDRLGQLLGPERAASLRHFPLDLTDNTVRWILYGEPRKLDVEWSTENVEARAAAFESLEILVVLADAPGQRTPQLRRLVRGAHWMLVVSNGDLELDAWASLGIPVLASVRSHKEKPDAPTFFDPTAQRGRVWGLERESLAGGLGVAGLPPDVQDVVTDLAYAILERAS